MNMSIKILSLALRVPFNPTAPSMFYRMDVGD